MNDGLDLAQFRDLIVRPTLRRIELWSQAAENLVIGTALHESKLKYIQQIKGPAMGLFQMEPATHKDLYENYLQFNPTLKNRVNELAGQFEGSIPDPDEMIGNLNYATAMCRIHYRRVKAMLPAPTDARGLATYAKRWYNTPAGKATVEQYEEAMNTVISLQ